MGIGTHSPTWGNIPRESPHSCCYPALAGLWGAIPLGWKAFFDELVLWRGIASANSLHIKRLAGRQDAAATKDNEAGPKSDLINRETNLSQK